MTEPAVLRVLVLDDEPIMLALMEHMLTQLGISQVVTFERGARALEWLGESANAVDLIVLDLNMPGMDGVEFLRGVVDLRFAGGVILASGEDETIQQAAESLVRAHRINALGHLHKPVQAAELAAMIRQWQPELGGAVRGIERAFQPAEIAGAIANRELVNHYQPMVALATGEFVGVETLVRWQHPRDGLVYPDRFIGIAEECGYIDELTQVVIDQSIEQARSWARQGLNPDLSINISMACLTRLAFPDDLSRQVERAGIAPSTIVLELTETRLMSQIVTVLDVLTRLRLKRFRLSIDDFGTGHSSLAQLRDIPFDELKVDRGFVHGASGNEKKRAICETSFALARQLGIAAVAEGVEDAADWAFLRDRGCNFAQGYFIARPMPGADLPVWLETWEARVRSGL
jgi:EAL domain-containing protein (putative c-di-GMP-specific phosphodiesterase class I)/CheY-like chemotaxis protein